MPILRYFLFVGGALLALLLVADRVFPSEPAVQAAAALSNEQPLIRIRSDRHLPERVVLDTSQPVLVAPVLQTAAATQPPVPQSAAGALTEASAKAVVRESFAQVTPQVTPQTISVRSKSDLRSEGTKFAEARTQVQPKRKTAKAHSAPQHGRPMMVVAQQPHFGLFNTTW